MSRGLVATVVVTVALGLTAATGTAQDAPPDVVRLQNGGMVRGTIIQLVPDDFVEIQLPSGETQRHAMGDVEWAGPAAEMPTAEPSEPLAHAEPEEHDPDELTVQLEAEDADTTFHLHIGDTVATSGMFHAVGRSYERLCTAPCETRLPRGNYELALSRGGGNPVRADETVHLEEDSVLVGDYQSRGGVRAVGWMVFTLGLIGGTVLAIVPVMNQSDAESKDYTWTYIGMGVVGVTTFIGFAMAFTSDGAEVQVVPSSP